MVRKPSVPERLRRQVQERVQGRCEYCLIHEADMYYSHEADHVIAEKHGGRIEGITSSGRATARFFISMMPKGWPTDLG